MATYSSLNVGDTVYYRHGRGGVGGTLSAKIVQLKAPETHERAKPVDEQCLVVLRGIKATAPGEQKDFVRAASKVTKAE